MKTAERVVAGLWSVAAVLGAPGLTLAQPVGWVRRVVAEPPPRERHAMAFDSARGVTVMYGGSGTSGDQTWEWNGVAWTRRMVGGPGRLYSPAMAYDSARGVTVLFGGFNNGATAGTWEWDGDAWTQRKVDGPPGRWHHTMVYDAARGVTVLFGGDDASGYFGDTWEWNGVAWAQRMVAGPSPRAYHAMAYDPARGVTVLFGGRHLVSGQYANDGETWEWDGAAGVWTLRDAAGLTPRRSCAMVYDASRGVAVLFGGTSETTGYSGETWEWDGAAWSRTLVSGPAPRSDHAMAFDSARGMTVLFGGYLSSMPVGGTWELGPPCSCPVNCDCSSIAPVLNVADFVCFQARFAAGDPYANCDGSTVPPVLNVADFICFQTKYAAGCP